MRNVLIAGVSAVALTSFAGREDFRNANYDLSLVAPYVLEDPLTFLDGSKVKSAADWSRRRDEILDVFAHEMYGVEPPKPETVVIEKFDDAVSLAGFGIRRQYRMWFRADKTGPAIDWLVLLPRHVQGRVPPILFLNYGGNHELIRDQEVRMPDGVWLRFAKDHRADPEMRGRYENMNSAEFVFPAHMILARGYAVVSACYAQVSPDTDPRLKERQPETYSGVFDLWPKRDPGRDDNTTAIGAWAWALSRGLDLAERIGEIDATRAIATGYSRLGKTCLLAAARDTRFAVCVPNQCGGGGVKLAKRDFGENIGNQMLTKPHWYCRAYAKYERDPAKLLTFDQHLLLATLAPRAVLVQGFDKPWFDTEGEFLACRAASPVWRFLGDAGLPDVPYPNDYETSAIGKRLGYVRRSEDHGHSAHDWMWLLDFCDKAVQGTAVATRDTCAGNKDAQVADFDAAVRPTVEEGVADDCGRRAASVCTKDVRNVLVLGDSLSDFDRGSNHWAIVSKVLNSTHRKPVTIYNYAVAGDFAQRLMDRLAGKGPRPERFAGLWNRSYDWAFVMLGANDTKAASDGRYEKPLTTPEREELLYRELVRKLKERGIRHVYLVSCARADWSKCQANARKSAEAGKKHSRFGDPRHMAVFNDVLKRVAAESEGVEYVDIYTPMQNITDISSCVQPDDGVHLVAAGYRFVANSLLNWLSVYACRPDEDGFVSLFNGKDLTGWEGATNTYCVSADGCLACMQVGGVGESGTENLWTVRDYTNFVMRFDVKLPPNANNGLGIRCKPNGWCSREGMELQLLDDWGDMYNGSNKLVDVHYTGSVYGVVPPARKINGESYLNRPNEWNAVEVRADGSHITFVLNGTTLVDTDVSKFSTDGTVPADGIKRPGLHNKAGRIHWCGHGHNIFWRNIRIRELP